MTGPHPMWGLGLLVRGRYPWRREHPNTLCGQRWRHRHPFALTGSTHTHTHTACVTRAQSAPAGHGIITVLTLLVHTVPTMPRQVYFASPPFYANVWLRYASCARPACRLHLHSWATRAACLPPRSSAVLYYCTSAHLQVCGPAEGLPAPPPSFLHVRLFP